ncbi:hypothetical protein [Sorangium sp. So ce388]|uniref:hypothetical protein n=1 Tax=Sorangium sp. So ce388 TaxID=3133309 RepID=UPI003F5B9060
MRSSEANGIGVHFIAKSHHASRWKLTVGTLLSLSSLPHPAFSLLGSVREFGLFNASGARSARVFAFNAFSALGVVPGPREAPRTHDAP